ncbi:hypothetical protein IAU60_003673 [Kwoniella sp. DSM 27419]
MSRAATTTTSSEGQAAGYLKLRGHDIGDAFPDLKTKGWTVVKGVIPAARAKDYEDQAYQWLESFGKGFDKDDKATWKVDKLPAFNRGGLFNRHGVAHEQWVWDIRAEEGVTDAFAKIWGTDELLVSFDGVNVSLPFTDEDMGDRAAPWPHVDQSPNRRHMHCVQGIVNLAENGPNDGGLKILEGSFALYSEFFDAHKDKAPPGGYSWKDIHLFTEEDMNWFAERGCKWHKVEAGPGDLILWDSRLCHYGQAAQGNKPRVATYVCYKPAKEISAEKLQERKQAIGDYSGTSHDPINFRLTGTTIAGPLTPDEVQQPKRPAVLSDRAQQLAGVKAY